MLDVNCPESDQIVQVHISIHRSKFHQIFSRTINSKSPPSSSRRQSRSTGQDKTRQDKTRQDNTRQNRTKKERCPIAVCRMQDTHFDRTMRVSAEDLTHQKPLKRNSVSLSSQGQSFYFTNAKSDHRSSKANSYISLFTIQHQKMESKSCKFPMRPLHNFFRTVTSSPAQKSASSPIRCEISTFQRSSLQ
jgi:hypothetical protein